MNITAGEISFLILMSYIIKLILVLNSVLLIMSNF
jgi:hypothetical protein